MSSPRTLLVRYRSFPLTADAITHVFADENHRHSEAPPTGGVYETVSIDYLRGLFPGFAQYLLTAGAEVVDHWACDLGPDGELESNGSREVVVEWQGMRFNIFCPFGDDERAYIYPGCWDLVEDDEDPASDPGGSRR